MTDAELMQKIKSEFGALIASTCHSSSVPESFIAALIANESGGDPHDKRFESGVFGHLSAVLVGEQASYGSISADQLIDYCDMQFIGPPGAFVEGVRLLRSLATSWGVVQIMGYEAIPFRITTEDLADPAKQLPVAIKMLGQFSGRFGLDVTKDFLELFSCWNTGRPHAPTADPKYIPNGLARKAIYAGLP